jgi:hypothetical protein
MHNSFYWIIIIIIIIIIIYHDPQHVSSITVLIFRRTIVYLRYLVSSRSVCCHPVHRLRADCLQSAQSALNRCTGWQHTEREDTRYRKYTIVLLKMSTVMLETCWGSWYNIIITIIEFKKLYIKLVINSNMNYSTTITQLVTDLENLRE